MALRKKHADGNVYEVYPLYTTKEVRGKQIVYDRNMRERSWFIIDLWCGKQNFIPKESTGLITTNNEVFGMFSARTGGRIIF